MSALHASAIRSYITRTCSSYEPGIPAGASGVSPAASARWPDDWIRLSTSRMFAKYSSTVDRSCGASALFKRFAEAITESRMLALALKRAARSSADPMSPNIRSNALCGFISFGKRHGRRLPRQRVEVEAAPTELARVRRAVDVLDPELERAQGRVTSNRVGNVLIDRLPCSYVRALRLFRGPAAEPERSDDVMSERVGCAEPSHEVDVLPQRREPLEQRRQLELAGRRGRPDLRPNAVRHVDRAEPKLCRRRGARGGHHRVEQRQADRCAERAAQHGASRKVLLRDEHYFDSPVEVADARVSATVGAPPVVNRAFC